MAKLTDADLVDGRARSTSPRTCSRSPSRPATPPASRRSPTSPRPGVKLVVCAPRGALRRRDREVEQASGVALTPVSEESSVTDVLGKVTSGEADAGLVYVTDVKAAGDAVAGHRRSTSPPRPSTPTRSRHWWTREAPDVATAFVGFVDRATTGQAVLAAAGFGRP